jgi:hypothetical protein
MVYIGLLMISSARDFKIVFTVCVSFMVFMNYEGLRKIRGADEWRSFWPV